MRSEADESRGDRGIFYQKNTRDAEYVRWFIVEVKDYAFLKPL